MFEFRQVSTAASHNVPDNYADTYSLYVRADQHLCSAYHADEAVLPQISLGPSTVSAREMAIGIEFDFGLSTANKIAWEMMYFDSGQPIL